MTENCNFFDSRQSLSALSYSSLHDFGPGLKFPCCVSNSLIILDSMLRNGDYNPIVFLWLLTALYWCVEASLHEIMHVHVHAEGINYYY